MQPVTLIVLSCSALLSVSAAPIATSTVLHFPGMSPMVVGLVGPSEVPNMLTPSAVPNMLKHSAVPDFADLLSVLEPRQIRINDYEIPTNSSLPSLRRAKLIGRNEKAEAEERARLQAAQATQAVQPSASPQGLAPTSPEQAASSSIQELGESRLEASDVFHKTLGVVFSGFNNTDSQNASSTTLHETYTKSAQDKPLPVGPGYTTDTMDAVPANTGSGQKSTSVQKSARRGLPALLKNFALLETFDKPHTMDIDLNALLPEEASTSGPQAAWQKNTGLINLDSNHPPPPPVTSANLTTTAANLADAQTPANITSVA